MNKLHSDFPETWEGNRTKYEVKCLPIKKLWASVPKVDDAAFYDRVKADIVKNGLHFPLLAVWCTRALVLKEKRKYKDALSNLPFDPDLREDLQKNMYTIWGGSQRIRIASELGFTHIDCAIIPDFRVAQRLQAAHRQPYGKLYHPNKKH